MLRMADFSKTVSTWWGHYGNATTVAGLPGVSFVVSGGLAWYEGLPAAEVLTMALVAAAAAVVILKYASRRFAVGIIAAFLFLGAGYGALKNYHQMQKYHLTAEGVDLGLRPYELGGTLVRGVDVGLAFANRGTETIFWRADKHNASINGRVSNSTRDPLEGSVEGGEAVEIHEGGITMEQPIDVRQLGTGTIDYHVCYGREKGHFDKYIDVQEAFTPTYDGKVVGTQVTSRVVREGKCDQIDQ